MKITYQSTVYSEAEFRALFPSLSLPSLLTQQTIDDAGIIATIDDSTDIDTLRANATAAVNAWRATMETGTGFVFGHDGYMWDGDTASKARLSETIDGARVAGLPEGFAWRTADNVDVPIDLAGLVALHDAMSVARVVRGYEIHIRQSELKAVLSDASPAELAAFVPGWPV